MSWSERLTAKLEVLNSLTAIHTGFNPAGVLSVHLAIPRSKDAASCPKCGVVFAKLKPRGGPAPEARRPAEPPPALVPPPSPEPGLASRLALPFMLAALAVAAVVILRQGEEPRAWLQRAPPRTTPVSPASPPAPTAAPSRHPLAELEPVLPDPTASKPEGMTVADQRRVEALLQARRRRAPVGAVDVETVEALLLRYPEEKILLLLAESVFMTAADQENGARHYLEAAFLLRRTIVLRPGSLPARSALVTVLLEASDWSGAEAAARDLLALAPRDASALRGLGQALLRQDRNKEAVEALRASLEVEDDPNTRAMLAHLEKGLKDEKGMSEKQLAHFHVRYDGAEHEDVGREMLRALERHFATLTSVFDHQPEAPIPVILFSQEGYYDAAGAPRWSGGVFNHLDGRIRIPIGGLTSALTPDIDHVLVHELTHAFIASMSRSVCPRDVHEGFAQYMEGKRIASQLNAEQIKALADGRMRGVDGFYLTALAFVEHLMGQRGQGGMNDLLRAMGETGKVDAAFERVYGQDHKAMERAFADRMRLQYGS